MASTMATQELDHATPTRRGRTARQAARLARAMETLPYLTRTLPPVEVISTEGLEAIEHNADTLLQEVGIEVVNFPEAVEIFRAAGADVQGTRVRFERGMCRQIVQATAPRELYPDGAQPGTQRRHRRPAHGPRAVLRVAVHPQPRRRPALRDDRGLSQLREAGLHEHDPPPRRRHAVRAHGPAGQQAPFRDGLQPHPLLGPGVHGLGDPSVAGAGLGRHGQDRVRRRDARARARDHGSRQRQLADVVGLQHARLGEGLRREQPDHADHPVHPRRGDGTGDRGRGCDPDAGRGAGRHGLLPDRAARCTGHLRVVRVIDVDADGRSDLRHAGTAAGAVRAGRPGAAARRPVPVAAATSRPPRSPTTRPRTRARSASWPRCRPA